MGLHLSAFIVPFTCYIVFNEAAMPFYFTNNTGAKSKYKWG